MYLVIPVIVIGKVTVLFNIYHVAYDRTKGQTLLICIVTMTMTMTKNKIQNRSFSRYMSPPPSSPWWRSRRRCKKSDEGKPKRKFFFLLRRCHVHAFFMTKMTLAQESRVSSLARAPSRHIPCGPSMMDYPETSGSLRKPASEVSGRFPYLYY